METNDTQAQSARMHVIKVPTGEPNSGCYHLWVEGTPNTSPPFTQEQVRNHIVLASTQTALLNAEKALRAADAVAAGVMPGLDYAAFVLTVNAIQEAAKKAEDAPKEPEEAPIVDA